MSTWHCTTTWFRLGNFGTTLNTYITPSPYTHLVHHWGEVHVQDDTIVDGQSQDNAHLQPGGPVQGGEAPSGHMPSTTLLTLLTTTLLLSPGLAVQHLP